MINWIPTYLDLISTSDQLGRGAIFGAVVNASPTANLGAGDSDGR